MLASRAVTTADVLHDATEKLVAVAGGVAKPKELWWNGVSATAAIAKKDKKWEAAVKKLLDFDTDNVDKLMTAVNTAKTAYELLAGGFEVLGEGKEILPTEAGVALERAKITKIEGTIMYLKQNEGNEENLAGKLTGQKRLLKEVQPADTAFGEKQLDSKVQKVLIDALSRNS